MVYAQGRSVRLFTEAPLHGIQALLIFIAAILLIVFFYFVGHALAVHSTGPVVWAVGSLALAGVLGFLSNRFSRPGV